MMEDWEIKRLIGAINLALAATEEHGIEPFRERLAKNPEAAIAEFPRYLDKVLNTANGLFRGRQAGGPCEYVTGPMLDAVGWVYSRLDGELRKKALLACLGFLDKQNYFLSQDNVALINEPMLVGDILRNRQLYWCGYASYAEALAPLASWNDFAEVFIDDQGGLRCQSIFWLIFALSRSDVPTSISEEFATNFPAISIRSRHTIIALLGSDISAANRSKFSDWLWGAGEPDPGYLLSL